MPRGTHTRILFQQLGQPYKTRKYNKSEEDHNGTLSSLYSSFGSFQDGFPVRAGYHLGHYYLAATADNQVGPNFYLTTTKSCHLHNRYPIATKY